MIMLVTEIDTDIPRVIKFYHESDSAQAIKDLLSEIKKEFDDRELREDNEDTYCEWIEIRKVFSGSVQECPTLYRAFWNCVEDMFIIT